MHRPPAAPVTRLLCGLLAVAAGWLAVRVGMTGQFVPWDRGVPLQPSEVLLLCGAVGSPSKRRGWRRPAAPSARAGRERGSGGLA